MTGFDLAAVTATLTAAPEATRLRAIGLGHVAHTVDTVPRLVTDLASDGAVAVLAASSTLVYRGGDLTAHVVAQLAELRPVKLIVLGPTDGHLHADENTLVDAITAARGAAAVVSVGSGTVTDIGKVVAERCGVSAHVVVQSAASVNGFADDQAVVLRDGVKRTVPSRWPDALVIDSEVLAGAPQAMNLAGIGDLAAMFTAPADWYLASVLGIDTSYAPAVVELVHRHSRRLLQLGEPVGRGDPAALAELGDLLTLSGLAMGAAGRTAPSSGMEHVVSHLLDMNGGPQRLHGAQVGVATVAAAATWRHVRSAVERGCRPRMLDSAVQRGRVEAAFDHLGAPVVQECWHSYQRKLNWLATHPQAVSALVDGWATHEVTLGGLLIDPAELTSALSAAGVPTRFGDLDPPVDTATARWALAHCHLMRDRFTIADLADLLGIWNERAVASVLAGEPAVSG